MSLLARIAVLLIILGLGVVGVMVMNTLLLDLAAILIAVVLGVWFWIWASGAEKTNQISHVKEIDMNPWVGIWTKPRATIRHIIKTDVTKHVIPLAMAGGIFNIFDNAPDRSLSDDMGPLFVIGLALIVGPIAGVAGMYISSALLKWSGRLIGGVGEIDEVRAAITWPSVIYCIGVAIIFMPQLAVAGLEAFTLSTPLLDVKVETNPEFGMIVAGAYALVALLALVIGIWYIIVYLKSLGEAHQFSAWRALLAVLIGFGVILVPLMIIIFTFFVAYQ